MENMDMQTHEQYMRTCIELAKVARQRGESPVGSVIVLDGKVVGEGIEGGKANKDITFHAEIEAIRAANKHLNSQDLSGAILYTTHEPCIMCSYVIRHAKIAMVVTGLSTGELGGFSSHLPLLSDTGIKKWTTPPVLIKGVLKSECEQLHI